MTTAFRCAAASLDRTESLAGTGSTVRSFVLVEFAGAWGREALRDARLPTPVRSHLSEVSRLGVKVLLVRRHGQVTRSPSPHVFVARCGQDASWLEGTRLDSIDEVTSLDLAAVGRAERVGLPELGDPLVCVCTHGRHDACCAERGRPVAAALSRSHPALTWEVSHIGGDRFAGNVVILPDGLYYGRVSPEAAPGLVAGHLAGEVDLDHLRGRSSLPLAAQAAEIAVRRECREARLDALRITRVRRHDDMSEVDVQVGAELWRVTVRMSRHDPVQLTCRAPGLGKPAVLEVLNVVRMR